MCNLNGVKFKVLPGNVAATEIIAIFIPATY